MNQLVFVCCRNKRVFDYWCRENAISPHDRRVVFLNRPEQLMGIENPFVLKFERWFELPNSSEIEEAIRLMTRHNNKN